MRDRLQAMAALLAMVAILVVIGAPNILKTRNRSRQKRSMADIRTIATAWEARATDVSSYSVGPRRGVAAAQDVNDFATAERVSFEELEHALVPTYARVLPALDAWGNPFELRIANFDADGIARDYAIRSLGRDGKADRDSYEQRIDPTWEADLVFANANWVQYPEGI